MSRNYVAEAKALIAEREAARLKVEAEQDELLEKEVSRFKAKFPAWFEATDNVFGIAVSNLEKDGFLADSDGYVRFQEDNFVVASFAPELIFRLNADDWEDPSSHIFIVRATHIQTGFELSGHMTFSTGDAFLPEETLGESKLLMLDVSLEDRLGDYVRDFIILALQLPMPERKSES